jgi:hypothetical protein
MNVKPLANRCFNNALQKVGNVPYISEQFIYVVYERKSYDLFQSNIDALPTCGTCYIYHFNFMKTETKFMNYARKNVYKIIICKHSIIIF